MIDLNLVRAAYRLWVGYEVRGEGIDERRRNQQRAEQVVADALPGLLDELQQRRGETARG